jgi:type II secretory ATPase GspE/PulE/Tfp pilus assembly ATPase PilB-like protein
MILVTGPTGSGKTTTLYSMLNTLNDGSKKIITLEDPIEYMVSGLQQSQINYTKGYDYATGLKAILRHDPEVILIGETRDGETAQIALNAALTGHLVFTTLHTNGALEAIDRIINMGVKSYMLAPALTMVMGQRLVRKLCTCASRKPADYSETEQIKEGIKTITEIRPGLRTASGNALSFDGSVKHAVGCAECNGTGYKGRIAVVEILHISDELKKMISEGKSTLDIYAKAREAGFLTLQEDALIKVIDGLTTIEEMRRVV